MRNVGLAAAAWALAACQAGAPDPLAQARRACADGVGEARIAGCTVLIDAPELAQPDRVEALAARAAARQDAGEVTPALRDYEAALRLDSEHTASLVGRAGILLASGQLDAAKPLAERAAAHDRTGRAQLVLARIAFLRGADAEAIERANAALGQDDGLAEAYALRARAKREGGDLTGARDDFSAAIQRDGALAEARAGRCWLDLEADENLARARDDAEAAVLADPRSVEAQVCRGVLQLRAREGEAALASFAAALAIEPGNPEALFGHGIARMRTGDGQGSRDMNRARDFSEHIAQRYYQLGVRTW